MRKIIILTMVLFIAAPSLMAQNSAMSYYRKIANEKRKVEKKRLKYVQYDVLGDNPKKADKYRLMVVTQVESSMETIKRMKPYKGDSAFRNDYVRVLDLYRLAYTKKYGNIQELEAASKNSYEDMMKYLDAVGDMEIVIEDAAEKLRRNEEYFSNKYNFKLNVDEEMEEQYYVLTDVLYYTRDVYRSYYRVEDQLNAFLESADEFDVKTGRLYQRSIIKAIEKSISEIVLLGDFDGDDNHMEDVKDLLEDLEYKMKRDLAEILDLADEGSYDERQWDKAMKKLEVFIEEMNEFKMAYNESRTRFVEDYLPDDFER